MAALLNDATIQSLSVQTNTAPSPVTLTPDTNGDYLLDICANDTTITVVITATNPNVYDITITGRDTGASWSTASSPFSQTIPLTVGGFGITVTSQNRDITSYYVIGISSPTTTTTTTAAPNVTCFLGNAPVATPTGPQRIDSLKEGDLVLTETGKSVPIQRVKVMRVRPGPTTNPYVIAKGSYGATEELLISPRHCVAVGGNMIEARDLGLPQKAMAKPFTYYNIELPGWANMRVAGVEVESLAPTQRVIATVEQVKAAIAASPIKGADAAKLFRRICRPARNGMVEVFGAMKQ